MKGFFSRWAHSENLALGRLGWGKTAAVRFAGLRRSNRNEAKLLLIAIAPTFGLMILGVPKWSDASLGWRICIVVASTWLISVVVFGIAVVVRAFFASMRKARGGKSNG